MNGFNNLINYYGEILYTYEDFFTFIMPKTKGYIKVDFDDDDNIIQTMIKSAIFSLERKTSCKLGDFLYDEIADVELYLLGYVYQVYNNRGITIKENETAINRMFSSILLSLKYRDRSGGNE